MRLALCGLIYGDYPQLRQRFLESLSKICDCRRNAQGLSASLPYEIRLALNAVPTTGRSEVFAWAKETASKYCQVSIWHNEENRCKYPMMRRLYHSQLLPQLGDKDAVVWFDDDTFVTKCLGLQGYWWHALKSALYEHSVVGQRWSQPLSRQRQSFLESQPWYKGRPWPLFGSRPSIEFPQGAFWASRYRVMREHNWPDPRLHHNGGDTMLGALIYQQNISFGRFDHSLAVNAADSGKQSSQPRRGVSQPPLGDKPVVDDLSHQQFESNYYRFTADAVIESVCNGDLHDLSERRKI